MTALAIVGAACTVPASPTPFAPSRIVRRGCHRPVEFEVREPLRPRHGVLHQGPAQGLTGLVESNLLPERLPNALHRAADQLPFDKHWIDDVADVIDRDEPLDRRDAGFTVDSHNSDGRAEGKRLAVRLELHRRFQPFDGRGGARLVLRLGFNIRLDEVLDFDRT